MESHAGHRERMRQKFLKSGPRGLTDAELLEIVLYQLMPRRDVRPLAEELLNTGDLMTLTPEAIAGVKGAGDEVALLVGVMQALFNRAGDQRRAGALIRGAEVARKYLAARLLGSDREVVLELCLDQDSWAVGCAPICTGPVPASGPDIKSIITPALRTGSDKIVLAHNFSDLSAAAKYMSLSYFAALDDAISSYNITLLDYFIFYENHAVSAVASNFLRDTPVRREFLTRAPLTRIKVKIRTLE